MQNRSTQLEIIDLGKPHYTDKEYNECLTLLDKISRYLGGDSANLWALKKVKSKFKTNPKLIIDFGCGGGFFSAKLAKLYPDCKIVGIDSSSMMEFCQFIEDFSIMIGKNIYKKLN